MKVTVTAASPDCRVLVVDHDDNALGEITPENGVAHFDVPEGESKHVKIVAISADDLRKAPESPKTD